jgi:hypothetical protein
MHLDLFVAVGVVDDPLQVEDECFWEFVEVGAFVGGAYLPFALLAEVV